MRDTALTMAGVKVIAVVGFVLGVSGTCGYYFVRTLLTDLPLMVRLITGG